MRVVVGGVRGGDGYIDVTDSDRGANGHEQRAASACEQQRALAGVGIATSGAWRWRGSAAGRSAGYRRAERRLVAARARARGPTRRLLRASVAEALHQA